MEAALSRFAVMGTLFMVEYEVTEMTFGRGSAKVVEKVARDSRLVKEKYFFFSANCCNRR